RSLLVDTAVCGRLALRVPPPAASTAPSRYARYAGTTAPSGQQHEVRDRLRHFARFFHDRHVPATGQLGNADVGYVGETLADRIQRGHVDDLVLGAPDRQRRRGDVRQLRL